MCKFCRNILSQPLLTFIISHVKIKPYFIIYVQGLLYSKTDSSVKNGIFIYVCSAVAGTISVIGGTVGMTIKVIFSLLGEVRLFAKGAGLSFHSKLKKHG